ncbi:MAG: substrate-binding domain-containing protein [Campylobacterota bacterium]
MIKKSLIIVCLAVFLSSGINAKDLMMATTTSTDNTGLLNYLAPKFEKDRGVTLKWVATGTGKALKMGRNCDVDILFVHAPASEKRFVETGYGVNRTQVMYNDFIIIGPKNDPANISKLNTTDALKKISKNKEKFFSRGDNSGTNKKEISLWEKAITKAPKKESWYIQTGQGMLITINMASEKSGYTMADRGTWIKYESQKKDKNSMKVLVQDDETLFNQYSLITINNQRCVNIKHKSANEFTKWITKPKIQEAIADFRLLNKALFIPNANN